MKNINKFIKLKYNYQVKFCNTNYYPAPTYSLDDLTNYLITNNQFVSLYLAYVGSGKNKALAPTVWRSNPNRTFSFENIMIGTYQEMKKENGIATTSGINNKRSKPVIQMDLNGEHLRTYYSESEASRQTCIALSNINSVCTGRSQTAGGFRWKRGT